MTKPAPAPFQPEITKVSGLLKGWIYGPVDSRRYGKSLGINILPPDAKLCSLDCHYCQLGFGSLEDFRTGPRRLPGPETIARALTEALRRLDGEGGQVETLTLSGNGEPTLHPRFPEMVDALRAVRDAEAPRARIGVLSNSLHLRKPTVRAALARLDLRVMKLDAGNEATFRRVDRPLFRVTLRQVIDGLKDLPDCTLQAMFVDGPDRNIDPADVADWVRAVAEVGPELVEVYTLDRRPADRRLRPVPAERLAAIAAELTAATGIPAQVF